MNIKGTIVEQGTTDAIFDNPQNQYTRSLIDAVPGLHIELGTGAELF